MTPAVFKESRKRIGLTQSALADRLGVTLRQVQNLESGHSPIKGLHELSLRWIAMDEAHLDLPHEYQQDCFATEGRSEAKRDSVSD